MTTTSTVLPPLTPPPARSVPATAHMGELPMDLLLSADGVPPSILDVELRLLMVRRAVPEVPRSTQRPVAPPSDPRGEQRTRRRQIAGALLGAVLATATTVATVATALA